VKALLLFLLLLIGCTAPSPAGHSHDGGHSHGGEDSHGEGGHDHGDEGVSVAITRWSAEHELFIELDAPVAGKAFGYHAHVTRMADNHAADSGALTLRFEQDGFAVESHTDPAVARPGIFSAEAAAPSTAGAYRLVVSYVDAEESAHWDGGEVQVGAREPIEHDAEVEGAISFLKEAQWQVLFRTALAQTAALAPTVHAPAVAKPAPASTSVVAAPTDGLLAWTDGLPVVGRGVLVGEPLAKLIPASAVEHWTQVQAALTTARINRGLATTELRRIEALVARELVPARRLAEVTAALERADAAVVGAEGRASALSSGSSGAVAILAPSSGVIVEVGAEHGEAVSVGTPLVTVSATDAILLEGHVHDRIWGPLHPVATLTAERGDWDGPRDLVEAGGVLLTERLVFDAHALSAPVAVLVPGDVGLVVGDLVELSLGVGDPIPRLVVPREAVVETSGQTVVFVQNSGESFSRRRVELGEADAAHVEVLSGVAEGERVVSLGAFDVHVASLTGSMESHKH